MIYIIIYIYYYFFLKVPGKGVIMRKWNQQEKHVLELVKKIGDHYKLNRIYQIEYARSMIKKYANDIDTLILMLNTLKDEIKVWNAPLDLPAYGQTLIKPYANDRPKINQMNLTMKNLI